MSEKCRIGVVGIGQRGADYLRLLKTHPGADLCALCDVSRERLSEFAEELDCGNVPQYSVLDEFLEKGNPDAVLITTPDFTHAECAAACLEAGKHVLLEKPMAPTADECRKILRAAEKSGKILQVGFEMRCHPLFRQVQRFVRDGVIGQLLSMNFSESLSVMHGASYMRRWHRKFCNSGGFLLAKCSHDLDMMTVLAGAEPRRIVSFGGLNFFTPDKMKKRFCSECGDRDCRFRFHGEMVRMTAEESRRPSRNQFDLCVFNDDKDVVDNQQLLLEYANGVRAAFSLNLFAPQGRRRWELAGTQGHIHADTLRKEATVFFSNGKEPLTVHCESGNGSSHDGSDRIFLDEFISCILHGTAPAADAAAGLIATVTANAAEKSRLSGSVVTIEPEEFQI